MYESDGTNEVYFVVGDSGGFLVIYAYYEGVGVNGKILISATEVGIVRFDGETLGLIFVRCWYWGQLFLMKVIDNFFVKYVTLGITRCLSLVEVNKTLVISIGRLE